jgi:hypothetical protein
VRKVDRMSVLETCRRARCPLAELAAEAPSSPR